MCGDISPVLNSRVNNCQTRGRTKPSRGERAGAGNWPASALWPLSQGDRGCMTPVIHPQALLLTYTRLSIEPYALCDNPSVINEVLIMPAAHRLCLMLVVITSVGLAGCCNWGTICGMLQVVCEYSGSRLNVVCSQAVCCCATLPFDKWDKMELVSRACLHLHCCDQKGRVMTKLQDIDTDMSTYLNTSQGWIVRFRNAYQVCHQKTIWQISGHILIVSNWDVGAVVLCMISHDSKKKIILRIPNITQYGSLFHCVAYSNSQEH